MSQDIGKGWNLVPPCPAQWSARPVGYSATPTDAVSNTASTAARPAGEEKLDPPVPETRNAWQR
jgi:hypothetical protein